MKEEDKAMDRKKETERKLNNNTIVEVYEKSSELYDALNSSVDKKLIEDYKKIYNF